MRKATKLLNARFNHGRWIVECPNCNGAELAFPGKPFVCGSEQAEMAKSGRKSRLPKYQVHFPRQEQINLAMAVLRLRDVKNMNWNPTLETVDDLINENRRHGVI